MTPRRHARSSALCVNWPRSTGCAGSPWACRTIWKRPSKKAPRACAWVRRSSARGRSRRKPDASRVLFAAAAGAHRSRRLFGGAAGRTAEARDRGFGAAPLRRGAVSPGQQRSACRHLPARAGTAGSDCAARCGAASLPAGAVRPGAVRRGVRVQLRRVESRPGAGSVEQAARRRAPIRTTLPIPCCGEW